MEVQSTFQKVIELISLCVAISDIVEASPDGHASRGATVGRGQTRDIGIAGGAKPVVLRHPVGSSSSLRSSMIESWSSIVLN